MLLARHLHWGRAEILALPEAEFRFYVRKIIESLPKP